MIIKSSRLPTAAGAGGTADHVLRGDKNEDIVLIRGSEKDLHDFVGYARAARKPYAIRHFKISSEEDISPEQEAEAVALLATEFRFDPERVVLVRHKKPRSKKTASEYHLHLLVPEWNPVTRRVLGTSWDRARHEKCSRMLEHSWGHGHVSGRFNSRVLKEMRAQSHPLTDALLALDGENRPEASHPQHQVQEISRRTEWTAGRIAEAVRDAHALAASANEFCSILGEQGLRVAEGKKGARWVVEAPTLKGGWMHAGSVNRLLGRGVGSTDQWMRGLTPTLENRKGRKSDGQAGEEMGSDGLHGDAGGNERPGDAPDDGLEWDDALGLGGAARGGEGVPADVAAGHGGGGRGGVGDHADRGALAGDRREPEGPDRAGPSPGRAARHPGRKAGRSGQGAGRGGRGDRGGPGGGEEGQARTRQVSSIAWAPLPTSVGSRAGGPTSPDRVRSP